MSELCIFTDPKLSAAEQAVQHVLKRFVKDRDFSWHMSHTETLAKCVAAEADRLGVTEKEVRDKLNAEYNAAQPRLDLAGSGEAQLVKARRRIDQLERKLESQGGDLRTEDQLRYEAKKEQSEELKRQAVAFLDDLHFGEKSLSQELHYRLIAFVEGWW